MLILLLPVLLAWSALSAQCGGGYTPAQVNWDKLDYYFNSGGGSNPPYANYVTNAMEQTQKFALGPNYVTIATSSPNVINPGTSSGLSCENTSHSGELAGYTGADVSYNPNAAGQTVTMTFNTEVTNLNFTLYDIDASQRMDFAAVDVSATPLNVNIAIQASTILTINNNNTPTAYVTASGTAVNNSSNQGSATITVAGPVKSITLTITNVGSNASFYLSDINACVTGSFPNNYNQTPDNQPMTGPVVNQPDYFIVTPDSDSAFIVDPVTGRAWYLFHDPSNDYMNSFAYDPYNRVLYYISEGFSINANNKTLKKFDFTTETISTVVADLTTTLNIPTFNYGVESAGAAFYNGQLFIGFEGNRFNSSNTRESIIYRLDLDGSGVPVNACQVFAVNCYSGSTLLHDWADFVIENGILYNYNSTSGTTRVSYEHYDMMTGQSTQYLNPNSSTGYAYQSGLTWNGEQYSFSSGAVSRYFENGTVGSAVTLVSAEGLTWQTGAGDASENFRPKCDFGDAPASYDPVAISPAVHERSDSFRLGATWDREWVKNGVTAVEDTDDGLPYVPFMPPGPGSYLAEVTVYNNSGIDGRLIAWLDYNGNGIFDASEAITPITVPSSASSQNFYLYWPNTTNSFTNGQSTFLRIRITADSSGMTSSHATGYFAQGEVEDYEVQVDNFPLSTQLIGFDAILENHKVKLSWTASEEADTYGYDVERSSDNQHWTKINYVDGHGSHGTFGYTAEDLQPFKGISYYRVRIIEAGGMNRFSATKKIVNNHFKGSIVLVPNPATQYTLVRLESNRGGMALVQVQDMQGKTILSLNRSVQAGSNELRIDLPLTIRPGTYILSVLMDGEARREKLIIKP